MRVGLGEGGPEALAVAGDAMRDDAAVVGAAGASFEGAQGKADAGGGGDGVAGLDPAIDDEVPDPGVEEGEDLVAGGEGEAEVGLAGVEVEEKGEISEEFLVEAEAF